MWGKDADQAAIKRSYRRLAQKLHPDANPDDPNAGRGVSKRVSEAYSVLSDPDRRKGVRPGSLRRGWWFPWIPWWIRPVRRASRFVWKTCSEVWAGSAICSGSAADGAVPNAASDVSTTLDLTFTEAVRGTTASVRIESPGHV